MRSVCHCLESLPVSGGLECHFEAEAFESVEEAVLGAIGVGAVEVSVAEVLVFSFPREHVVDIGEDAVGDGDCGPLLSATGGEANVLGLEVAATLAGGGMRCLGESGPQPAVSVTSASRTSLAGAFIVAGTDASPGAKMAHRRKAA